MTDMSRRKPLVDQPIHSLPGEARFLTPTPKRPVPVSRDLESEGLHSMNVHRHSVIPVVPRDHRLEPGSDTGDRPMHAPPPFGLHFLELGPAPLLHREAFDREASTTPLGRADMRQS